MYPDIKLKIHGTAFFPAYTNSAIQFWKQDIPHHPKKALKAPLFELYDCTKTKQKLARKFSESQRNLIYE